ncbi:MAG: uncharacterized protein JWO08_3566 [Verrucomicrobiaceae bacterium]|nr:uncharacterized protein [Verrucomicrobiaceae bacterium]
MSLPITDGQTLFIAFTLFYQLECLHWLPLGSVVLRSWAMRRGWAASHPSPLVSARFKGLAMTWPLPPLGSVLVAQPWPVIPDMSGLWIGTGQAQEGKRLDWAAIHPNQEERTVKLAANIEVHCTSLRAAQLLTEFLTDATTKEDQRMDLIEEFWRSSLSLPRARAAVRRYLLAAGTLRAPCMAVFFISFVWIPLLFWRFGGNSWSVLIGFVTLLIMTTLVAFVWQKLDFRLFPNSRRKRWTQMLHFIFMPAHTIRAHDLIGTEVLAGLHPLPAAARVLKSEALKALASHTWRSWKFRSASDALIPATAVVLPRLEDCCRRLGLSVGELEEAPPRQGAAASFCPRCHSQFSLAAATCGNCGEIPTRKWNTDTA